ncbi:MAG: ABC transporter ATP-binding protein [Ruminiclostridium sp.]
MGKMFKLLGKKWLPILVIILLLFVQAYCDLALPEYTSNIVNVGIQQSGISDAVPEKIRQSELIRLEMFMTAEDADYVKASYTTGEDGICVLDLSGSEKKNKEARERLNGIFGKPMLIAYMMNNMTAESDLALDFSQLSGNGSMEEMKKQLDQLDESIISQIAVSYVKDEYTAIGVDTEKMQNDYMLSSGMMMIVYAAVAMLCTIIIAYLSARVAAGYGHDLRNAVFRKVMTFSSSEFDSFSTASLITRSTNDIQQVIMVTAMMLRMIIYAPIVGIGALSKVLAQGNSMAWVIGVAILGILVLVVILFTVALPKFQIVQKLVDNLNLVTREILTGLPVIRAFSTEEHEKKRFDIANIDLTKVNLFVNRVMTIMMPTMMFIMNGISVLILWVGSNQVDLGRMQVGDIMAFITYTMQIIMAFVMLAMMSVILPRAIISMRRISEVLNKEISISDPENPQEFDESKKGVVEFRNVSFHYPGAEENVLNNISFITKPGETTAIIGSTGSGKSTLANLIPRFFDVTEGEILVDGADIRNVKLSDLRDKIGYVPQKAVLFSGTIASNITYSDENMSREQMEKAAEIAQSTDFIMAKPDKFHSDISQGGSNVSGGQKQRISIARAIAKHPEIYIFDDSFSALDYKTDVELRKALRSETENSTVIIVAQRISTVLNADRIIVLDEGKVAGMGTHKELMSSCEVYRQIALSQLSSEELDGKENA